MYRAITLVVLLFMSFSPVAAQQVGEVWSLVERDLDIPAHPGPGESAVTFRYDGGSLVQVIRIDAQTGWFEVVDANRRTGWISRRYFAALTSQSSLPAPGADEEHSNPIAWCPPKASPELHSSGRLRIATWNVENLHAENGKTIYSHPRPSVSRQTIDYERIRCYVRMMNPDVLAVQEVDGEAALSRIVDTDVYNIHVSDRPKGSLGGQQNTGFAWRKGLIANPRPDFDELDFRENGRLRYGARLDVQHQGVLLEFMSVHLKSGCFSNRQDAEGEPDCTDLDGQIPRLESWIDSRANDGAHFVVLGDFNRRFNQPGDRIWALLDDSEPANADLSAATLDKPISCRDNEFTAFIDHIVTGRHTTPWIDASSFRHMTYRQADKQVWSKISDHCPVIVDMWIEP